MLNNCMRPIMLSIASPFLSLSSVHVRYTFSMPVHSHCLITFSCLFPPSSNVMLTMSPSPNPHPHVQSLAELVAWTRQQSAWSAVVVLVLATRRQLKMFYQNNNNFRPLLRPPVPMVNTLVLGLAWQNLRGNPMADSFDNFFLVPRKICSLASLQTAKLPVSLQSQGNGAVKHF